jgi:organic hydroperoxide reductase OsmC/OhrA
MKEYYYEVDLFWESESLSSAGSHGLQEIEMINSSEFGRGKKSKWTPEHLLAASVSSSLMSSFLEEAKNSDLKVIMYKSQSFVKLESKEGKYLAAEILIRPIIKLSNEKDITKAYSIMDKAEAACPIKNGLKIKVQVHPQFDSLNKTEKIKP